MKSLFAAVALLAAAPFAATPAFAAAGPVSLPQLAPGEVLLEVNAAARVTSPASSAILTVSLNGRGPTAADARAELRREVERVTAASRAAGAAAADVREVGMRSGNTFDGGMGTGSGNRFWANTQVEIRLRNASAAPGLYRMLNPAMEGLPQAIFYEVEDDSAPRRQARDLALRNARTDAESYAAAANMRIVRVLRVTERLGLDTLGMAITESNTALRTMMDWSRTTSRPEVQTYSILGVDYVLAPR